VTYYITGTRKSVAAHEAARLVSEFNEAQRDENVAYYLAKLDALIGKFEGMPDDRQQGELALDD
jgi:hypothetical protein